MRRSSSCVDFCRAKNADLSINTSNASCSGGITAISNCLLFSNCVIKLCFFSDAAVPLSDDSRNEIGSFIRVQNAETCKFKTSTSARSVCQQIMSLCCILDASESFAATLEVNSRLDVSRAGQRRLEHPSSPTPILRPARRRSLSDSPIASPRTATACISDQ